MNAPWRLRGYSVEQLLGTGASSEVWRARVNAGGAAVALKRIHVDDVEQARRAEAEAALLTALDHPHLVRLHALVPSNDATVLVLDLAEGGSLAQLLAARQRLTPGEVITAVAPIAAALAYLHDEGVVHGDVSAANILFTAAGIPLLADVGVARLTGDDRAVSSTPAYVDPAVAAGCVPGPRSDVFMLGAVALHALTGRPAWSGTTDVDVLAAAATGRLDDLAARLSEVGVPDEMARVVRRALEVDPHRRGTAADLALDLRHSGEPVAVELGAGRERGTPVRGPRHAAPAGGARTPAPADRGSPAAGAAADSRPVDPARPAFERPSGVPGGVGLAPPTRLVGPRPRPVIPRPAPRGRRRRTMLLVLAGAAVALLGTAGTVWASTDAASNGHRGAGPASKAAAGPATPNSRTRSTTAPTSTVAPGSTTAPKSTVPKAPTTRSTPVARSAPVTRSTPVERSTPVASTTPAGTSVAGWPGGTSATSWHRALDALDTIRATAFATRDDTALQRVYASELLLRTDTELLHRIVPSGCGLAGARTTYRDVRVAPGDSGMVITATATLASSRLVCAGQDRGTAPGLGPARLRIELVRVGKGARIADQRRI